ncbi:sugar ABC transporter permease, partial [Streptomyces hawaiiensis]
MTATPAKAPEPAAPPAPGPGPTSRPAKTPHGHRRLLTRRDRITLGLMAGVPTILHVTLVWLTALASIA